MSKQAPPLNFAARQSRRRGADAPPSANGRGGGPVRFSGLRSAGQTSRFLYRRWRYFAQFEPSVERGEAVHLVDQLNEEGLVRIPGFLADDVVAEMYAGRPDESDLIFSPEGTQTRFLLEADRVPAFAPFFEQPLIASVARGYL